MTPLLIVADDNPQMRWLVRAALSSRFDVIVEAGDGRELFRQLVHAAMTHAASDVVVITDIRMPTYSGLDVIATYDELGYHPPTVVMTSFPDADVYAWSDQAGSVLLPKPFATAELRRVIDQVCQS